MPEHQANRLPESLQSWVEERATVLGAETDEVVSRAVTLYRLVEEHAEDAGGVRLDEQLTELEAVSERLTALEARVEDADEDAQSAQLDHLTARVADVEDDLVEKITDVRERVIQVKREADEKADADHDHADLQERLDQVATEIDAVDERAAETQSTLETGFENFEEITTYLADETEEFDDRLESLAHAVNDLRQRTTALERRLERENVLQALKRSANRQGVEKGQCESCEKPITVGLLTTANCPHCEAPLMDITPPGRFFGTATLKTRHLPALEAGDGPEETAGRAGKAQDGSVAETVSELFGESSDD